MADLDRLKAQLKTDEGFSKKPYRCTAGKLTIGYGRNIDDKGISTEEADYMLQNDIRDTIVDLNRQLPFFHRLPDVAQEVLINMGFMGVGKLMGFTRMLRHMENFKWAAAADELLNSKYAKQVGARAVRLAEQLKNL